MQKEFLDRVMINFYGPVSGGPMEKNSISVPLGGGSSPIDPLRRIFYCLGKGDRVLGSYFSVRSH